MGLTLTALGVGAIIACYWLRESVLAAVAGIFFALGGAWIYIGSTTWDITRITAFGIIGGGVAVSYLSFSIGSRRKEERELDEQPHDEIPLADDVEGRERRKGIRTSKRMKRDLKP